MYRMFIHLLSPSTFISFLILLFIIGLIISHKILKNKNLLIWRLLCFIPFITCIVHLLVFNFHYSLFETFKLFGIMYLSSLLLIIWQFFSNKRKVYMFFTIMSLIGGLSGFIFTYFNTLMLEDIHNFSYKSYTESFNSTIKVLKEEYPLNEHKQIAYDYLYNKYYPSIVQAEKNKDSQLFYKTLFEFSNEFKDSHFSFYVTIKSEDDYSKYNFVNDYENKDYGFTTILLDNGNLAAILVDENSEAYKNGLRDGMIITKKDGTDVLNLIDKVQLPTGYKFPVLEDERLVKSLWLFSTGNKNISVSFLDETGNEKTINVEQAPEEDFKYRATEVYEKIFYYDYGQEHLATKMLNNDIGYIYIAHEQYSFLRGVLSYVTDDASYLTKVLDEKLNFLKEQGMSKLIIDLRGNTGGYVQESSAIASLFTNDTYYYEQTVKYKSKFADKTSIKGNGKYKDLPITVLVNSFTISAGDGLAYLLSKCDNVTIVGITTTNHSFQSVGGRIYLTNGEAFIDFPTYSSLDMSGNILIDTNTTGKANIKLDYKIPLNSISIKEIVYTNEDYVLNYAINLIQ